MRKLLILTAFFFIVISQLCYANIEYVEKGWFIEEYSGLSDLITTEFKELSLDKWEVNVKLDNELRKDLKNKKINEPVEDVFNRHKHKLRKKNHHVALDALKKADVYPIKVMRKICDDEISEELMDCYYGNTKILTSNKNKINLINNEKFIVSFKNKKFSAGQAIKIGFNSIIYVSGTDRIMVTTNSTELFEDIYQEDLGNSSWNQTTKTGTQYNFNARVYLGDNSAPYSMSDIDKDVQIADNVLTANYDSFIYVSDNVALTLGEVADEDLKTTSRGVSISSLEDAKGSCRILRSHPGSTVYVYSSSFMAVTPKPHRVQLEGTTRFWNSQLKNKVAIGDCDFDAYRVNIEGGDYGMFRTTGTLNDIRITGSTTAGLYSSDGVAMHLTNSVFMYNTAMFRLSYNTPVDSTLTNVVSDNWDFLWRVNAFQYVWRYYNLDLKVVDTDGQAIPNASVDFTDTHGTTFSSTTNSTGSIPQMTLNHSRYNSTTGLEGSATTTIEYNPYNVNVEATGYNTYMNVVNVTTKTAWNIAMLLESAAESAETTVNLEELDFHGEFIFGLVIALGIVAVVMFLFAVKADNQMLTIFFGALGIIAILSILVLLSNVESVATTIAVNETDLANNITTKNTTISLSVPSEVDEILNNSITVLVIVFGLFGSGLLIIFGINFIRKMFGGERG